MATEESTGKSMGNGRQGKPGGKSQRSRKTTEIPSGELTERQRKEWVKRVDQILERVYADRPRPEREISFVDTLIAIILSQNTSDRNSHRAYLSLRSTWPSWEEIAEADPADVAESIRTGGLADQKSRTIQATLHRLIDRWGNLQLQGIEEMPDDDLLDFLTSIRGVGLKSASCAMMFALDRDLCAVDTHLHRILNRLGIVRTSSPDRTFSLLRPLVPKGRGGRFHVNLIRFGREICKARNPHCFECPLFQECRWEEKEFYAAEAKPGPRPVSGDFLITDGL